MSRIRLLLVDDSSTIRGLVSSALANQPDIEVVGAAQNGQVALQLVPQVKPDIILLDVEMPVMDGLETLAALRKGHPAIPVVMFSSLTDRGTSTTVKALFLGASDFAPKPSGSGGAEAARSEIREVLLPKLRGLRKTSSTARPVAALPPRAPLLTLQPLQPASGERIDLVAVGASTGGPAALAALLKSLRELPVPMVIVQHMPPLFTRLLVESLARECAFPVREGVPGQRLDPGQVWLAPGDHHMETAHTPDGAVLRLHQGPKENACRPAVDVLFSSVARTFGRHAAAVVLTGIGDDGLRGAKEVRRAGGVVLAQDEASSVVWGMPRAVFDAGITDAVVPLAQMGVELGRRLGAGRVPLARGRSGRGG